MKARNPVIKSALRTVRTAVVECFQDLNTALVEAAEAYDLSEYEREALEAQAIAASEDWE